METIEYKTPQRFKKYQLASLAERFIAFAIDLCVILMTSVALFLFLCRYYFEENQWYTVLYCSPIFMGYSLLSEQFNNGRSLGKYCMNLRVIKTDGSKGRLSNYLTRWVYRSLDLYLSLGTFAIVLFSITEKNQRLGDVMGNTVVVKEPAIDL